MPEENQQAEETILLSWQAKEFEKPQRDWRWYLGLVILVVLGGLYAWYIRQWLLFGVLVVLLLVVFLSGRMAPRISRFALSNQAISSGKRRWDYSKFKSFWIEKKKGDGAFLHLFPKARLSMLVSLPLGDLEPGKLKETLTRFLPEESKGKGDILGDITRRFGI